MLATAWILVLFKHIYVLFEEQILSSKVDPIPFAERCLRIPVDTNFTTPNPEDLRSQWSVGFAFSLRFRRSLH